MRKILKIIASVVLVLVLCFASLVGYLMITEYKPKDVENLDVVRGESTKVVRLNEEYSALDWNVGYFGLDKDEDFFKDGGKMIFSLDKEHIENNMENITKIIKEENTDSVFLQEVDVDSKRTYNINQVAYMDEYFQGNSIFAYNFKVKFIPYPLPPLGKMNSGIYTTTKFNVVDAKRYQLPIPFKFPVKMANLKRAFSVSYVNIEDSDKKLVLINAHLDAYDEDNSGKIAQTKALMSFMDAEYKKGNYVLLGADFNQDLRDVDENVLSVPEGVWGAKAFDKSVLSNDFKLYYDESTLSARVDNKPYEKGSAGTYEFLIDGYIASKNIEVLDVKTLDKGYEYSDHNPVKLRYKLTK